MTKPGCTCSTQHHDLNMCPTYIGAIVHNILTDAYDEWAGSPIDDERIEPYVEQIITLVLAAAEGNL